MSQNILCDLSPGERKVISAIDSRSPMKRRLIDLGFSAKSSVECVAVSPLGDPKAFLIKNTVIALRSDDSKYIYVE